MKRCKHCGARALPLWKFCDFCGTPLGQGLGHPVHGSGPGEELRKDFDSLVQHPEFHELLEQGPKNAVPNTLRDQRKWGFFVLALFIWIFDRWGGFACELNWRTTLAATAFLIEAYFIRRSKLRARAFPGTHLESLPVCFLKMSSRSDAKARLPVTILVEMPLGKRRKLRYEGLGADQWKEGDYGVAHVKANVLVEFQRLSV